MGDEKVEIYEKIKVFSDFEGNEIKIGFKFSLLISNSSGNLI